MCRARRSRRNAGRSPRPGRREDRILDVADRGDGLAHLLGRVRTERVLLRLHRPARALVGREEALGDEPLHPDGLTRREQVVRALRPKAVGRRERAVEVSQVHGSDGGQLVDDHVRLRPGHGLGDLVGIERVGDDRFCAHVPKQLPAWRRYASCRAPRGPRRPALARAAARWHRLLLRQTPSSSSLPRRLSPLPIRQDRGPGCDTSLGSCAHSHCQPANAPRDLARFRHGCCAAARRLRCERGLMLREAPGGEAHGRVSSPRRGARWGAPHPVETELRDRRPRELAVDTGHRQDDLGLIRQRSPRGGGRHGNVDLRPHRHDQG